MNINRIVSPLMHRFQRYLAELHEHTAGNIGNSDEQRRLNNKLSSENGVGTYEVVVVSELGHGGALAAGDDERVEAQQLLRLAHLHPLGSDPPQRCTHTGTKNTRTVKGERDRKRRRS
jgi:hypothetical protein